jgi:hypothetical protein
MAMVWRASTHTTTWKMMVRQLTSLDMSASRVPSLRSTEVPPPDPVPPLEISDTAGHATAQLGSPLRPTTRIAALASVSTSHARR